jgi:hypothetical protein
MLVGLLGFAAVMFIILVFVVALVRGVSIAERRPPEVQLAARFARGEIGEGEYLRNLAILQHGTQFLAEVERPKDDD